MARVEMARKVVQGYITSLRLPVQLSPHMVDMQTTKNHFPPLYSMLIGTFSSSIGTSGKSTSWAGPAVEPSVGEIISFCHLPTMHCFELYMVQ